MLLDTQSQHFARFDAAGFDSYTEWYRCLTFLQCLHLKLKRIFYASTFQPFFSNYTRYTS